MHCSLFFLFFIWFCLHFCFAISFFSLSFLVSFHFLFVSLSVVASIFSPSLSQEGGLPLLLCLAQPPPREAPGTPAVVVEAAGAAAAAETSGASGAVSWEIFASAVRLLRRACMLSANRSDLLSLKVWRRLPEDGGFC